MNETLRPTINKIFFVSGQDLQLMQGWPPEMRALFDPQADQELAQRIVTERGTGRTAKIEDDHEIPF